MTYEKLIKIKIIVLINIQIQIFSLTKQPKKSQNLS